MIVARSKTVVQLATVCLVASSAAMLLWATMTPVTMPPPPLASARGVGAPPEHNTARQTRDLTPTWKRLFLRRFQRPLYDPVVKMTLPPVRKVTLPPVHLIATMPETAGAGSALLEDASGKQFVVRVGGTIGTAGNKVTLVEVHDDRVEIQFEETNTTLKLKRN